MTQDERWQAQYDQMMAFMKENHRQSWGQRYLGMTAPMTQVPVPTAIGYDGCYDSGTSVPVTNFLTAQTFS